MTYCNAARKGPSYYHSQYTRAQKMVMLGRVVSERGNVQNSTFFKPNWSPSVEFGITGSTTRVGFSVQVAKTPTYPVMCRFLLFVASSYHHNSSTLQTDERTDGRYPRSISVTCNITYKHTRGHSFKLFKRRSNTCARSSFFSERVVNAWNSLPHDINFNSVASFKRSIAKVDFTESLKVDIMSSLISFSLC